MPELTLAQQVNLGVSLANEGRLDEAIAAYRVAIAKWPNVAEAHFNLANALKEKRLFDEAIQAYRLALTYRANFPEAHNNAGNALAAQGRDERAIAEYRAALAHRPNYAQAHYNLANSLRATGEDDAAIAAFREAIRFDPAYADAHNNLAAALEDRDRLDEALALRRRVIELRPDWPQGYINLSNLLNARGETAAALAAAQHALALQPADADGQMHIAWALLLRGEMRQGFKLYESRWRTKDFAAKDGGFSQPLWDGTDIRGKRILLRDEQGLGDAIQFVRYARILADRGATVIAQVKPALCALLEKQWGIETVVAADQPPPEFDVHASLMSLPHLLDTTLATIPANIPYLHADPIRAARWRERMGTHPDHRHVGLVWAGNPANKQDRRRSLPLSALAPLAKVPRARFYSLQKGAPAAQATHPPTGMELIDWTAELEDFSDTAAMIDALDLVIACDTAVAHLAGAMGKAIWLLIPFSPDWRWMQERTDSPWYPTMRLFRQQTLGKWEEPIAEIARELARQ